MKNKEENKTKGFNKEIEEPNSNKVSFENGPNLRKKRSQSKRINYTESDTDSDFEARTRIPRGKSKNYQTSPTNDIPVQVQPSAVELNMDHKGTGTDLSLTDAESNEPTPVKQRSTCKENEERLSIELSSEDNHQSETKKTKQTVFA